ncbi:hypothetical protein AB0M43_05775 [Longispora sp. NPDC051575]|uniref:hypothetical protein n=1 Tax=Longispora sp. NPDC051575 TaxID=3154943 RepID=UPI00342A2F9E
MFTVDGVAALATALSGVLAAAAGLVNALRRPPTEGTAPRPAPARRAGGDWLALGFGLFAWLVAAVLVAVVGTAGPGTRPVAVTVLAYGIAVPVALAVFFGVRSLSGGRSAPSPLVPAAGILAAVAAVVATFIAAGPTPS